MHRSCWLQKTVLHPVGFEPFGCPFSCRIFRFQKELPIQTHKRYSLCSDGSHRSSLYANCSSLLSVLLVVGFCKHDVTYSSYLLLRNSASVLRLKNNAVHYVVRRTGASLHPQPLPPPSSAAMDVHEVRATNQWFPYR